jgi:tetratricopeptide (TPR) repeat protein
MIAWANLGDAYEQKHDTASMIGAYLAVYRLDPTNTAIAKTVVSILSKFGSPKQALDILDALLAQNPGDGDFLRAKWLVLSKSGDFKKGFVAGQEYVKGDSARADLDYFRWQIRNAQLDSNTVVAQALTEQAARKFANDVDLQLLLAQGYRKAGLAANAGGSAPTGHQQLTQALVAARRASQIEPKNTRTTLLVIYIQNDLGQPDSAMATAQQAIASGQSRDSIGQALLANVGPAFKIAQDTKARADWETALKAAQTVDAIAPSAQSKFYTGFAAFNVGADALTNVQALQTKSGKDDRAKACSELKVVEDMFATTSIAMPAGGVVDKATANQILASVTTYAAYIPQFKTTLKCK